MDKKTQAQLKAFMQQVQGFTLSLAEQNEQVLRAFLDLQRSLNVGLERQTVRGVEPHEFSVGATPTEPIISRNNSFPGREEIFIINTHATLASFLARTRAIATADTPGRIPLGTNERLQFLTIPWPAALDVWIVGAGAATTGLILEIARGGR